ncbi:M48 family metallopeptidase [Selenomonas ruminantium]|nr:M48 family metallopeptidase [Selenomonas ruminantium]
MGLSLALLSGTAVVQPQTAEAISLGDIGGLAQVGIQYKAARDQLKKQVDTLNLTSEGSYYMLANYKQQVGVDHDPAMNRRLANMMQTLTAAVRSVDPSIDKQPYKYFLNPDRSFNAFCGMGHVMSVNRGAFEFVAADDELAFVVGHEMGHGQKAHAAKGVLKAADKQLIASIASASLGGTQLTNTIAGMGLKISKAHSTKDREWEADDLAWEYITHTNYNIGAGAAVWQRMLDKSGNNAQKGADMWFNPSDHPNNAARRDNYVKKLTAYSGKHVTNKDGVVMVNGKKFVKPAAAGGMSSRERSYFVMGNLAAAYHNGHNKAGATVNGNTVMLGAQPILTCAAGDESARTLADRLNSIK